MVLRWSQRLVGAPLVAVLLLAVVPGTAQGFEKAIWGKVYRHGVNQFPIYKQLGVSIYQADLWWNQIAPSRPRDPTNPRDPAYRWPAVIHQAIIQARKFHMQVALQILFTPGWANGGRPPNWAPKKAADYARFATAASREYPTVHLWMIWGEPDRHNNFEPLTRVLWNQKGKLTRAQKAAPHKYARMLDQAYGALKKVSRKNVVIGGCTEFAGDIPVKVWIKNLRLPNGRPPRMDMYAHNPFGDRPPSFHAPASADGFVEFPDLPRLARWIDHYLHPGLRIFLSEWGVPTAPEQEFNYWVDPRVAAKWVSHALWLCRHWKRIYALGWVHVYDKPPLTNSGLIHANGKHKLLFKAFAQG